MAEERLIYASCSADCDRTRCYRHKNNALQDAHFADLATEAVKSRRPTPTASGRWLWLERRTGGINMPQMICKSCGLAIVGKIDHDGMCMTCYKYEKAHRSQRDLVEKTVEARQHGMSYGQYEAKKYAQTVKVEFPWKKDTKETAPRRSENKKQRRKTI